MLIVHHAERADHLVAALATLLAQPGADPFTAEVVAVPTRGIERWVSQRLSVVLGASPGRGDGVCANIEFPTPSDLVDRALLGVTGVDPATDPWSAARCLWPLAGLLDEHLDDEWLTSLRTHIVGPTGDRTSGARRLGAARRLASLFDRYGVQRPGMLVRWAAGDDVDGRGDQLPPGTAWQATLWRTLRSRLGVPSPAERLGPATEALRNSPGDLDLPPRVALFGVTRLAPSVLTVLDAVASGRDVHLLVLHPSPSLWVRIGSSPDPMAEVARSPLLATWGRDACELQLAIAAGTGPHAERHEGASGPGVAPSDTLLRRLQADIHTDTRAPGPPGPGAVDTRALLAEDDDSVQVHACHGRARQVEVLRDAILHLLVNDPSLELRDVIVMCPDIETFAPLVNATFGTVDTTETAAQPTRATERQRGSGQTLRRQIKAWPGNANDTGPVDGLPQLRVRLADRAVRQTNPVLAAVAALLELAMSRVTATELLDLAGLEPVRRRFRFSDDDLARLHEWVGTSGVRWGLDAAHREPYGVDAVAANAWRAGLDRLLVGVTMTEDDLPLVGGVLPLDDVDSSDIELAGRFAELVDRVHRSVDRLSSSQTMPSWADAIGSAVDQLATAPPREAWQRTQLDRLLHDLVEASTTGGRSPELSLAELTALLADHLAGRPGRANFRTGHLTICTLVPMRSVPHRVVCLLGLDDGEFPRQGAPDGDDILERSRQIGDRDVRSEDRQLLLDALLAATDHLVITYGGRDERTNAVRPPAVPVGELLDVIDATARVPGGDARDHVVTEHPLQPFDRRNFEPGTMTRIGPWSFDTAALDGAVALTSPRCPRPAFVAAPLPAVDTATVELEDLVRFVQHPVKAFLRSRLGLSASDGDDELDDAIPIELDALDSWGVGQRLLDARLAGVAWSEAVGAEVARGLVPPEALGQLVIDEIRPTVEAIHAASVDAIGPAGRARSVDVTAELWPGRLLTGTVTGVFDGRLVTASYSRVGPKHRIAAWVRLLALTAGSTGGPFSAVTVGKGKRSGAGTATVAPIASGDATEHLRTLLDLYDRGMREPLPLYCKTSEALARNRSARAEWETGFSFDLEDRDAAHLLVLGGQVPFARLLAEPARADEGGPGWSADVSRLARYARRLWGGLLAVERRDGL